MPDPCPRCGASIEMVHGLDLVCSRIRAESLERRRYGDLREVTHELLDGTDSTEAGSDDHRRRIASVAQLYEVAADHVACGKLDPVSAIWPVAIMLGVEHDLRTVAANREDKSGWSSPVTAEERVHSLSEAGKKLRAALADGSWRDLK